LPPICNPTPCPDCNQVLCTVGSLLSSVSWEDITVHGTKVAHFSLWIRGAVFPACVACLCSPSIASTTVAQAEQSTASKLLLNTHNTNAHTHTHNTWCSYYSPSSDGTCSISNVFVELGTRAHIHTHIHMQTHAHTHTHTRTQLSTDWAHVPKKQSRRPADTSYVGLARTIYIRCVYGIFGREITIYTVIYGVCIRFWPNLLLRHARPTSQLCTSGLETAAKLRNTHSHTHTYTHTWFNTPWKSTATKPSAATFPC